MKAKFVLRTYAQSDSLVGMHRRRTSGKPGLCASAIFSVQAVRAVDSVAVLSSPSSHSSDIEREL